MRRTKEEAEQTKKDILESALATFDELGYERASLSAIAKNAGVTRGAIYWHFKDKSEILREILKDHIHCIIEECLPQKEEETDALSDIRYMLNQYIGKLLNDSIFKKYVRILESEILKTNEELNNDFFKYIKDIGFRELKKLVEKGKKQNLIREEFSIEFIAFTLFATITGAEKLLIGDKNGLDFVGSAGELVESTIKLIKK